MEIDEKAAKSYASQGQTRTAALALKLAEREIYKNASGEYPVLLLDGDGCDRANTMDGQTATRLDAFLEMLHSKQEALV